MIYNQYWLLLVTCSFIILSTATTATATTTAGYQRIPECEEDFHLSVALLPYELYTDSPRSPNDDYYVCPRSDYEEVQHWQILFRNSTHPLHSTVQGAYYLRSSYPARLGASINDSSTTIACTKGDSELIVNPKPHFEGKTGMLRFTFISHDELYAANFTVKYANTGVYSDESIVYFKEGVDRFALLKWYIYYPDPTLFNIHKLSHDGIIIKDQFHQQLNTSLYGPYWSVTKCPSLYRDQTYYFILAVLNPAAASSTGEYVLSIGDYSDTITLVLDPSAVVPPVVLPTQTVPVTTLSRSIASSSTYTRIHLSSASSRQYSTSITRLPQPTSG